MGSVRSEQLIDLDHGLMGVVERNVWLEFVDPRGAFLNGTLGKGSARHEQGGGEPFERRNALGPSRVATKSIGARNRSRVLGNRPRRVLPFSPSKRLGPKGGA